MKNRRKSKLEIICGDDLLRGRLWKCMAVMGNWLFARSYRPDPSEALRCRTSLHRLFEFTYRISGPDISKDEGSCCWISRRTNSYRWNEILWVVKHRDTHSLIPIRYLILFFVQIYLTLLALFRKMDILKVYFIQGYGVWCIRNERLSARLASDLLL